MPSPFYITHRYMARKIKAPSQPLMSEERELLGAVDNETEYVEVRGRRIGLRDMCGWTRHKISKILLKEDTDEFAIGCKCLAAARLNGYFSIKLLWWILWRWYYFVRRYTDSELTDAVCMIKKKVASESYFFNTMLLIGMRETMMSMNREEVAASLRERFTDRAGKSAKSDSGSDNPSES